jgi:hypothetical protein
MFIINSYTFSKLFLLNAGANTPVSIRVQPFRPRRILSRFGFQGSHVGQMNQNSVTGVRVIVTAACTGFIHQPN